MTEHNLAASDYATEHGGAVLALTMPVRAVAAHLLRQRLPARHDPGLGEADGAPARREEGDARDSADGRDALREAAGSRRRVSSGSPTGAIYVINETFAPENKQWEGKSVADIAKERDVDAVRRAVRHRRGRRPHDRLRVPVAVPTTTRRGQARMKVWRDPRAVVGATDAGAHLDFLATFNYSTALLGKAVRERGMHADRGGDPPAHRRARAPVRADGARPRCRRAGTPTSS